MKKGLLIFFILTFLSLANASHFVVCKSTYALCTTAKCENIAGEKDNVSCNCKVKTGFSAGNNRCQSVRMTSKGKLIYSRYYPIRSYVKCTNQRSWAWCLDSPCIIDKKDPSKASCLCSVVQNKGSYVVVTDKYTANTCATDMYSSALISQINAITDFLKTQKFLKPFPLDVINAKSD